MRHEPPFCCLARAPGEANTRLIVRQSVGGLVDASAESVASNRSRRYRRVPNKFQSAGIDVHTDLAIIHFNPGSASLVTEPEIQGQVARHSPVVLNKAGEEPVALMPFSGTCAAAYVFWETEGPISRWVAGFGTAVP